jgi:transposase-like protein
MAQGMSNSAACRKVGINRRTGSRWRYGRKETDRTGRERFHPPIAEEPASDAVSPRYLSEDERVSIADLLRAKKSLRAIARELGRDPATTPPRSAGRYAATATRARVSTTLSRLSGELPCAVPSRRRARYGTIRS